jgi:ATP adenylyltransferase
MERLYSPWRMAYLNGPRPAPGACFLCDAIASDDDVASLVVHREEHAVVILNRYPYISGHAMVVPRRHVGELEALGAEERMGIMNLTVDTVTVLKAAMTPEGCNVGLNLGRAAGAGVPEHLHVHVVPRWTGDTNFMPVLGGTMVLPEALETTREKLSQGFRSVRR